MIKNKVLALSFFAALHLLIFSSAFAQVPKKIKTIKISIWLKNEIPNVIIIGKLKIEK